MYQLKQAWLYCGANFLALVAASLSLLTSIAWLADSPELAAQYPFLFKIKLNTALLYLLCSIALLASSIGARKTAMALCGIVIVCGGAILLQYLAGISLGIDELLVKDFIRPDSLYPGRSGPNSNLAYIALALGILINARKPELSAAIYACATVPLLISIMALTGHVLQVEQLFRWSAELHGMSVIGALCAFLGSMALIAHHWSTARSVPKSAPLYLTAALCFSLLMCDLLTSSRMSMGITYLPLVFCAYFFTSSDSPFRLAVVASALLILGLYNPESLGRDMTFAYLNRALAIAVIWLIATLIYFSRRNAMRVEKTEGHLQAVLEHVLDGIIVIDGRGIIEQINPAGALIFGYDQSEIIGRNVSMLMPEPYHSQHDGYIRNYQKTGERKIIGIGREVQGRRKDGTVFPLDLGVSEIVTASSDRRRFCGIIRDITARKEAETVRNRLTQRLYDSNTELERFAYVCSHDLQEPLRMIGNYTQRLEKYMGDKLDDKARHYMSYIVDGVTNARALISGILAYARLGNETEMRVSVDCEEILLITVTNLQQSIDESGAQITHDPLPCVYVNRTHMQQLLQNFISNAIKFRGAEPPRIHIGSRNSGAYCTISIQDNGLGIDPEYQQKVFEIFQRLHSRTEYPGSGIGLAVCKKIVGEYGGKIWLKSEPGKGSTFYFSLPLFVSSAGEAASA